MAKPDLDHLLIRKDIQVTDVELGVGAYGRVFEVEYAGLACAAKEIHPIFFRVARREELERIKAIFLYECQIWSTLRHPNIVQFIGVHYPAGDQSGLPIMVMEKMLCSLRSLVERHDDVKIFPSHQKLSILHDISLGLWYLHIQDPPIVHRDLTPNNILLGSHLEAKITDLGVAKVIKNTDSGRKLTKAPGTPHFMPPEALDDNPVYDTSLDIFSYGAVSLYVTIQLWPEPKARERFNPTTGRREVVSEVERRKVYLDKMTTFEIGAKLKPLVLSCLDDDAAQRPKVAEISKLLKELCGKENSKMNFSEVMIDHSYAKMQNHKIQVYHFTYDIIVLCKQGLILHDLYNNFAQNILITCVCDLLSENQLFCTFLKFHFIASLFFY